MSPFIQEINAMLGHVFWLIWLDAAFEAQGNPCDGGQGTESANGSATMRSQKEARQDVE